MSVGTAATAGDGAYASSLSYTPTTAGDHLWWYASIARRLEQCCGRQCLRPRYADDDRDATGPHIRR